eukprot:scaffold194616_cov20-Tisochrysis_lutea.AAC.3
MDTSGKVLKGCQTEYMAPLPCSTSRCELTCTHECVVLACAKGGVAMMDAKGQKLANACQEVRPSFATTGPAAAGAGLGAGGGHGGLGFTSAGPANQQGQEEDEEEESVLPTAFGASEEARVRRHQALMVFTSISLPGPPHASTSQLCVGYNMYL